MQRYQDSLKIPIEKYQPSLILPWFMAKVCTSIFQYIDYGKNTNKSSIYSFIFDNHKLIFPIVFSYQLGRSIYDKYFCFDKKCQELSEFFMKELTYVDGGNHTKVPKFEFKYGLDLSIPASLLNLIYSLGLHFCNSDTKSKFLDYVGVAAAGCAILNSIIGSDYGKIHIKYEKVKCEPELSHSNDVKNTEDTIDNGSIEEIDDTPEIKYELELNRTNTEDTIDNGSIEEIYLPYEGLFLNID
jgi:hypothetical protein